MRLQKRMANLGVASRRASEQLIAEGKVRVNGSVVTEPGTKVTLEDVIEVEGRLLEEPANSLAIVLHKPVGVVCTRKDPEGRETIYDLLDPALPHLAHVGRLDIQTEGVLLLASDGDLVQSLLHPSSEVPRVYHAKVRGRVREETLRHLRAGVPLDGRPTRPVEVERIPSKSRHDWLQLVLTEGKNRHVRRVLEDLGHPVSKLKRVAFAGVTVEGLPSGRWRKLKPEELRRLKDFT